MQVLGHWTAFSPGLCFFAGTFKQTTSQVGRAGVLCVCDSCLPAVATEAVYPDGKHPSSSSLGLGLSQPWKENLVQKRVKGVAEWGAAFNL